MFEAAVENLVAVDAPAVLVATHEDTVHIIDMREPMRRDDLSRQQARAYAAVLLAAADGLPLTAIPPQRA